MKKLFFIKRNAFAFLLMLIVFSISANIFSAKNVSANNNLCNDTLDIEEIIDRNNNLYSKMHCGEHFDLIDGYTGPGYNLEELYYLESGQSPEIMPTSLDNVNHCDANCSSHGPGRENGGIDLLNTGCRNYGGMWYYGNYGSIDIPYWINMTSMNTITNSVHRQKLIDDIRYQANLWNSTIMHDGTGNIINLYEVGIGQTSKPSSIDGRSVVEIKREDGDYAGLFSSFSLKIKINYDGTSLRGGRNIDTPLHEMGHLLGLSDLDDSDGIPRGTHKTVMGYNRGTTELTLDDAIKYQDIQGIAVMNNRHTEHQYYRYVVKNGKYLHICFYCDRIDTTNSPMNGASYVESSSNCTHEYRKIVSCGNNHWVRCRKCYKVIKSDYELDGIINGSNYSFKIVSLINENISDVNIPNKIEDIFVTHIGSNVFENCLNLQNVSLSNNLTSIGDSAFKGCTSLSKIILPNSVQNIDSSAFENCSNLQNVTLSNSLTSIGNSVFKGCTSLSTMAIPNSVQHIGSSAFENCSNLQNITLSNNLTSIDNSAFKGCTSLSTMIIPNSVQHIGSSAFENCSNLQNITLPNNLTSIGNSVFKECFVLSTITIPNSVQHIGSSAFEKCHYLRNVTLSTNLIDIGSSAFKGCSILSKIILPNSVQHVDSSAFENCISLFDVTLSTNLIDIGSSAFKGCSSLITITIPDNINHIDSSAFENCIGLSSITLSNNLNAIGTSAFKGCTRLTNITLPSSVQNIDYDAFRNCSSLSLVTVQKETAPITNLGQSVFSGCSQSLQIVVPMNRVAEYKNKQYWSSYKTKIVPTSDNYTEIDLNCLSDFYNLTTLSASYNKLYKLNVECAKTYKIFSNSDVSFGVYNYAMDNVASGQNAITTYLGIGTYYLSIEFTNNSSSGMVVTNYDLAWGNQGESINYNTNNDVTAHLHQVGADFYKSKLKYNNSVSGFYQIVLTGFDLNGNEVAYPSGMITIYSDSSRTTILDRYDISNNNYAINETGENVMYIYLPEAYCYIDIHTDRNDFESLTLNILPISEISLDYLSSIETITQKNIIEDVTDFAYFKQVTISHRSKFILEVLSNNNVFSELPIYIFKKLRDPGYEAGDDHFYIEPTLVSNISFSNAGNELTIILDAGTYYFGYSNNTEMSLSFTLTRVVNNSDEMYNTLITDPGAGFVPGSEVRFNNGLYGGLTITEGFTRNLFFSQEYVDNTEESRLEYDWYSSNPNVASVSEFGTVLALKVNQNTKVKIYAINKADPSIVYAIELTILKETSSDEIEIFSNMSYSYSQQNGSYQLELDFTNSPYPHIQYYSWQVESISTDVELYWGYVTATGPGTVSLVGTYWLNPRVHIFITLTITE